MNPRFARGPLSTFALLTLLLTPPAFAAETADASDKQPTAELRAQLVAMGRKLANERCRSCHATGTNDTSLNKDAPPFREFAGKWPVEDLEESLAEGIVTGHEEMPEFVFTPDEITAFTEFLRSFEKPTH